MSLPCPARHLLLQGKRVREAGSSGQQQHDSFAPSLSEFWLAAEQLWLEQEQRLAWAQQQQQGEQEGEEEWRINAWR